MTNIKKRLLCLGLSAVLFVTWELPVLAQNLTELNVRLEEQQKKERMDRLVGAFRGLIGSVISACFHRFPV